MTSNEFQDLLTRYLDGQLAEAELSAFREAVGTGEFDAILDEDFGAALESETEHPEWTDGKKAAFYERIRPADGHAGKVRRLSRFRWIAAASVLILIVAGVGYWRSIGLHRSANPMAVTVAGEIAPPASARPVLTLANGQQIAVSTAAAGTLAMEGKSRIQKTATGELIYRPAAAAGSELLYNTLTVPRGSRIVTLTLSDGTKVWLNAGSALRYPVVFAADRRSVTLTGEGYFEVAKAAAKPFFVASKDAEVGVLGTHFNVNAYPDDAGMTVTLLEGKVQVSRAGQAKMLAPGQQALVEKQFTVRQVDDMDRVMAWKNGYFLFHHTPLEEVGRQLGRWYDVDVVYEGKVPNMSFGGGINRNTNLSEVLKMLGESRVVFRIENKTIIVSAK